VRIVIPRDGLSDMNDVLLPHVDGQVFDPQALQEDQAPRRQGLCSSRIF
jgi:hypothetical protein